MDPADRWIIKADTGAPDPAVLRSERTDRLTVTNRGLSNSSGTTVTDVLPPGLTFGFATDGGTAICPGGALEVGASQEAGFVAAVDPARIEAIANTAIMVGNEIDPPPRR